MPTQESEHQTKEIDLTSSENSGMLRVRLTDEEISKLNLSKRSRRGGVFNPSIQYIDPSRVIGYFLSDGTYKEGSPKLIVDINFREDWERIAAGSYLFTHEFTEEEIARRKEAGVLFPESESLLRGFVSEEDVLEKRIDPKYVEQDDSGVIIPITRKNLAEDLKRQRKGVMGEHNLNPNFNRANRLAKILGLDVSKYEGMLKKKSHKKYLQNYSTLENLTSLLERFEDMPDLLVTPAYSRDDEDYEESPMAGEFREFTKNLEEIVLPNDEIRLRIANLLKAVERAYQGHRAGERAELEAELERRTELIEAKIEQLRLNEYGIWQLTNKVLRGSDSSSK